MFESERQQDMEAFIENAQKATAAFMRQLINKCPEIPSNEAKNYIFTDMERNIALYFDEALEDAKTADKEPQYA